MSRLIDANEIKKREKDVVLANGAKHRCFDTTMLSEIPTVDAVPVVRCKDCEYGEPNGQYGCKCYHHKLYETHEMSPNDFCSKGKRREDADK